MTIQEQLIKLNKYFEKMHSDFSKLELEKRNLDAKYDSKALNAKTQFDNERNVFVQEQEEVLKFYRIAKDNSFKELAKSGVNPQKPDLARLNSMIERVNSFSRSDSTAGQIIDLCSSYCVYLDGKIRGVDTKERTELGVIEREKISEADGLKQKQKRVLQDCESYLKGEEIRQLVQLFETIHQDYEITESYFNTWDVATKRKKMMLYGFSQYRVDVPQKLCPTFKNSLGYHFDVSTKMVNCPCGFTTDSPEEIIIEYTDMNYSKLKAGIQALILNYLRYFKPEEYKVSIFDYIFFNSDILGPLNTITTVKNNFIDRIPTNDKEMKAGISILADYYKKIESKLGNLNLYEYNRAKAPQDRIPYRILIINRTQATYVSSQDADIAYIINNASKFGILLISLTKSTDGGSKGKDRDKKFLSKATDYIHIISDAQGGFYVENNREWLSFKWLDSPNTYPAEYIGRLHVALEPVELGTKYFDRFKYKLPTKTVGKRKPVSIPFAIDEDDNVWNCDFENTLFACFINGIAGSGKSTLLHTIISGLIMNYHPDELELWLVDFKMTELKRYAIHKPPHIKYLLLEKSQDLVFDLIDEMEYEMNRRKSLFSQNGWKKLSDVPTSIYMPVIFVIIDEFAQMSQIIKETKNTGLKSDYALKLENILRESRAVGFKFIFSSQTYSDGVDGLTDSAKKQINSRIAMANTPQEIKDTLEISSDSINPMLQNTINNLPPFESLYKWRENDDKKTVRINHLKNMYTEDDEVDKLIDYIAGGMSVSKDTNNLENTRFVNKNPILIEGDIPKSFRSQVPHYKRYESTLCLDNLDDDLKGIHIYPGVPCSFNLAKNFELKMEKNENILVVGGNIESELSIILSIINSYGRDNRKIEIWSHNKNLMYRKYRSTVLGKYEIVTELDEICSRIEELKKSVKRKNVDKRLVIVLGYEKLMSDMEYADDDDDDDDDYYDYEEEVSDDGGMMDMAQVLAKMEACTSEEERNRILEEYNAGIAADNSSKTQNNSPLKRGRSAYDAREDMERLLKSSSDEGIHFAFCFGYAKDFSDTRIKDKFFKHKIAFSMSRDDSSEILGSRIASEIDPEVCVYSDGIAMYTMHPHIYRGVPCNGWYIDDKGSIVDGRN